VRARFAKKPKRFSPRLLRAQSVKPEAAIDKTWVRLVV
jgi:hypothetical protein